MLKEWIRSLCGYYTKANKIIRRNINGEKFSTTNLFIYYLSFVCLAVLIVIGLPSGIPDAFIDYIKDIMAIFVGFFVTVLTFVFDKLDVVTIPTQEEMDKLPVSDRWSSEKILKVKQEHNYTIRFFYTVGLIIVFSILVLCLLIPNIYWPDFFNIDLHQYELVSGINEINKDVIIITTHCVFCFVFRFAVIYFTLKVFYFTLYSVSSLLQVLISKKRIESWK